MINSLIIKSKKEKNANQNPLQLLFNRLRQKVDALQKESLECSKILDKHLEFYENELFPKIKKTSNLLREEIKVFYPYLEDKMPLRKEERSVLKQVIVNLFDRIADVEGEDMELDEELSVIFKATVGFSYQEQQSEEFEEFKKVMEAKFSRNGTRIDLTDVKQEGSRADAMEELMNSMSDQGAFDEKEKCEDAKARSKKQIKKENHLSLIQDLQKKEIRTIYKQLAKSFHPDLEIDPAVKLEKELMMKKLISAYEERDLHTLLSMELEIKEEHNEEQLKVYNNLLQSQVDTLQEKLRLIPRDQKYNSLQNYSSYQWKKGDFSLNKIQKEIDDQLQFHNQMINQCQSENALQTIRKMIDSYRVRF